MSPNQKQGKRITPQPKISQELRLQLRSRALSQHTRRSLTGKPTSWAQRDCVTKHGQISRCGSAPLLRFTHRHTRALSLSPSSHKQEVYMREVHVISMTETVIVRVSSRLLHIACHCTLSAHKVRTFLGREGVLAGPHKLRSV